MENKEDANGSVRQMEDFSAEQPTGKVVGMIFTENKLQIYRNMVAYLESRKSASKSRANETKFIITATLYHYKKHKGTNPIQVADSFC